MARKKLSIAAAEAKKRREPEVIGAEILRLETLLRKSQGKAGLGDRVMEIQARLDECRSELEAAHG